MTIQFYFGSIAFIACNKAVEAGECILCEVPFIEIKMYSEKVIALCSSKRSDAKQEKLEREFFHNQMFCIINSAAERNGWVKIENILEPVCYELFKVF